jgi:hypothetical protein
MCDLLSIEVGGLAVVDEAAEYDNLKSAFVQRQKQVSAA